MKSKIRRRIEVTALRRQSLVHSGEQTRPGFEEHSARRDQTVPDAHGLLEIMTQAPPAPLPVETDSTDQLAILVRTLIEAERQSVRARRLKRSALGSGILKLKFTVRKLQIRVKSGLAAHFDFMKLRPARTDTKK